MSGTRAVAADERDQILRDAVSHQWRTVLTRRTSEGWRTYKSTFASGSRASETIVVSVGSHNCGTDFSAGQGTLENPVPQHGLQPGETLGVTFRLGHKNCMFSSVLQSVEQGKETALFGLRWPDHLHQLQRRAYNRVSPPKGSVVAVRFWHEDTVSDPAKRERTIRHGQLEDVSAGGLRIKVADPKDMQIGQTYRCVFSPRPGAPPLFLEATLRHREAAEQGRASLGFQIIGLQTSPEGRRTLDRLARVVSQFQTARRRTRS